MRLAVEGAEQATAPRPAGASIFAPSIFLGHESNAIGYSGSGLLLEVPCYFSFSWIEPAEEAMAAETKPKCQFEIVIDVNQK